MSESDYAERPRDHGTSGRPSGVTVPGWPVAFRGSQAIAAGLVTRGRLRGPRFQRLLPDVYCRAVAKPDLLLRSLAAYRLVEGRGVLAGYSAALVLGAACAPHPDTPAEVTVAGDLRAYPGLVVHRDRLTDSEVTRVRDVACTTPLRTAFDLARRPDPVEAVVAGEVALANRRPGSRPRSPLEAARALPGLPAAGLGARPTSSPPASPGSGIADASWSLTGDVRRRPPPAEWAAARQDLTGAHGVRLSPAC